jgi:hypothetical protein
VTCADGVFGKGRAAGLAPDHTFATKPQLAKAQAERAVVAGLDPQWAAGDEAYGRSTELRAWLGAGLTRWPIAPRLARADTR